MNKGIFILAVCLSIGLLDGIRRDLWNSWFINDLKPCKLVEESGNSEK
jgi:hypothetical protein